jgi:ABC-type uncharacterized transport system involved in gliding motility auxiliary subunit
MNKALTSFVALLAIAVAFIAVNILSTHTLRGTRLDLTSDKLFTLSPGTRSIAKSLDEPITLKLYFSEQAVNDLPQFKTYGLRVKELLREYVAMSGGKIRLELIDPEPFTQAEDDATAAGLVGVPTGRGEDRLYFGLVGAGTTDQQQVLPFLDPTKEQFLEYDISRMIYLLSNPKKKVVGVMSWLPLDGGQPNPMMRQMPQPWQILNQLREYFDVRMVETEIGDIPSDVSVLMIVHPKKMSEQAQYAVDQFVLRGGRVLLFVDPLCDVDVPPGVNPMQAMGLPRNSELSRLMTAWGVELTPDMVAGDRRTAIRVNAGSPNAPRAVDYMIWMNVGSKTENLSKTDQITGTLQSMIMASAGVLKKKEGATTSIEPLIETTTDSTLIPVASVSMMPDPEKLIRDFVSSDTKMLLAARVTGKVKTAFPEGRPAPAPPVPSPESQEAPGGALLKQDAPSPAPQPATGTAPAATNDPAQLTESKQDINVIIITDCDMLADRFWITEERLFGQIPMGYRKMSDNGDFVIGALDQLSGSSDLLSLRARGLAARPFELVDKIRREAEQRYKQKVQDLQDTLTQTETKIAELQKQRGPADSSDLILSAEQQAELDKFNKERLTIRGELRSVQHQLSEDIEGLGTRIKFINIAVMPAVVALVAVGLGVYRRQQRTKDRASVAARG